MDFLSMFIIAVLGVWFVSGIIFMYKKGGKGCSSCEMNCTSCIGCGRRKEYEEVYQKKDKK